PPPVTDKLERALDDIRRKWVPDRRLGVFEVTLVFVDTDRRVRQLQGVTSSTGARDALRRLAADASVAAEVTLLPNDSVGPDTAAIVTAALAPLLDAPAIGARRVSEALHGEPFAVLERSEGKDWVRVRAPDGYHAWMHEGYLAIGPSAWADDWVARATARSLGAELLLDDGARLRLPLGARVAQRKSGALEAADGRAGTLHSGVVRLTGELGAEARLLAPPEWALRWLGGAPYAWGGRTEWGIDCSGLTQATYAARGLALPRDADLQFLHGQGIPPVHDGAGYEAGDLLFFAEGGRVTHVALWAGAGRIVHAALARGGVGTDEVFGRSPSARRLAPRLVGVRRVR
ncbi:MAG: NlpC/P60 family protein, partial [Gemmatimonadales bacterium]